MSKLKEGQKFTVDTLAHIVDHQDGGGSTRLYRDKEHFIEYLIEDGYDIENREQAEAKFKEIEDEDDPYENGEFDTQTIELVVRDGKLVLADDIYFSWGQ